MKRSEVLKQGKEFRFPNSGVVLGRLAGALRLKHVMYQGEESRNCSDLSDYKRLQSYFQGERIKPKYVTEYVTRLVQRCVPVVCQKPAHPVQQPVHVADGPFAEAGRRSPLEASRRRPAVRG